MAEVEPQSPTLHPDEAASSGTSSRPESPHGVHEGSDVAELEPPLGEHIVTDNVLDDKTNSTSSADIQPNDTPAGDAIDIPTAAEDKKELKETSTGSIMDKAKAPISPHKSATTKTNGVSTTVKRVRASDLVGPTTFFLTCP